MEQNIYAVFVREVCSYVGFGGGFVAHLLFGEEPNVLSVQDAWAAASACMYVCEQNDVYVYAFLRMCIHARRYTCIHVCRYAIITALGV